MNTRLSARLWLAVLCATCLPPVLRAQQSSPSPSPGPGGSPPPGKTPTATVTFDISPAGRQQTIDGFGTCVSIADGQQPWWQNLYFDDLRCSLLRMDLSPTFAAPVSDYTYNSPWFHNHPALPGPDDNNVRTYTGPDDYSRAWTINVGGKDIQQSAPIAVMGPDIDRNIAAFNFDTPGLKTAGTLAKMGQTRMAPAGGFRLFGSLWSPAPWLKVSSGNKIAGQDGVRPRNGTPWPFIWNGCFAGGRLDVSGALLAVFNDKDKGGEGPTSALTQFSRATAAFLRGFQKRYGVALYAVSIQNEVNFEEFYGSCAYPLSSQYLAAVKAVRAELNRYPDLAGIKLEGPEDLLGDGAFSLWQFGDGDKAVHKNLQYLQNIAADPQAAAAVDFFSIHGYAPDGVKSGGADPVSWKRWTDGWTTSPAVGLPEEVKGFNAYGKKSWMTETSGEDPQWLAPATGYPEKGAFSIAVKLHQALTAGRESAWAYWQLSDGKPVSAQTLTDATARGQSPKLVAARHYFSFIRPGAVRVNTTVSQPGSDTPLLASGYVHDGNGSLAAVLINPSESPVRVAMQVPALPRTPTGFSMFVSNDKHLWQITRVGAGGGRVMLTVPGYGVATLYGVPGEDSLYLVPPVGGQQPQRPPGPPQGPPPGGGGGPGRH